MNRRKYARILEESLHQGETREQVSGMRNRTQKRLEGQLKAADWIREKGEVVEPRPGFIESSRGYLVSKITSAEGDRSLRRNQSWNTSHSTRLVLVTLIVLIFFGGSMMGAAGGSLPGDPLYALRTAGENLAIILNVNAENKAQLHRMYAQEYLIDCAEAASQGRKADAETAFLNYERHMAGLSRTVLSIRGKTTGDTTPGNYDVSQMYLQDMEIFRVLIPGAF